MKVLCIGHGNFETFGMIPQWARERGYELETCLPCEGAQLPPTDAFDFLIVFGGPQSPLEMDDHPYLHDEIAFISSAIRNDKMVFGYCLGAQLVGEAVGAQTERSPNQEVGVFPLNLTEEGQSDPLLQDFPNSFNTILWHKDMPGLTPDCTVLASSEGCPRQIVRYTEKAVGFQCHSELRRQDLEEVMFVLDAGSLGPGAFRQTSEEIRNNDFDSINRNMVMLLDKFVEQHGPNIDITARQSPNGQTEARHPAPEIQY